MSKKKHRKRRNKSFRSVINFILVICVVIIAAYLLRTYVAVPVQITGDSMADTYKSGDIVIATRFDYRFSTPQRGDVALCGVEGRDGLYVKRVVAIPGDTVSIDNGTLYVNGEAADEPYVTYPSDDSMAEITLGADEYMVLGDNRADSYDSRESDIGLLHASDFSGKVRFTVWGH